MSIRRETTTLSLGPKQAEATPTGVASPGPFTISERLGIQTSPPPTKWPEVKPFRPQFKEVPVVSGTVVDDVFDDMGVYVDPTGGFLNSLANGARAAGAGAGALAGKAGAGAGKLAGKAAAKANTVVRKAAAGKKAMAASLTNKLAGMDKFDFKTYDTDEPQVTAILAVARKAADGQGDEKNNIKSFRKFKHKKIVKTAENQEAQMLHKVSLTKTIKGKTKVSDQAVTGRSALALGYSQVEDGESEESKGTFGDALYNEDSAAGIGVPTIVQLDPAFDTNKVENMFPMTALVVEALDTDDLSKFEKEGKSLIKITMQAIPQANITKEVVNNLTQDQVEFEYTLCVHGLYVNAEKGLIKGRKILVHQKKPDDITAYGISTPNGIESALHHAMVGTEIDLLYLWSCYRLVQGVYSLGQTSLITDNKKVVGKLLGEGLGKATQFKFSEDVEDDEFDELNDAYFKMY